MQAGEKPLNVSLSIGIAAAQSNRTATDELLRDADVAMYEAKEGGKRRFAVFTPEMRDSIVRRHDLKEELAQAIKHRDLVVQYQPIVDIQTGEAISVEALVRWNHADRGRDPADGVHPAGGGHRPDRAARPLRAGRGLRGRRASARTRCRCR